MSALFPIRKKIKSARTDRKEALRPRIKYSRESIRSAVIRTAVGTSVSVNWWNDDSNWNVNVWNRDKDWNDDNRVFSPILIYFFRLLPSGSFIFEALLPSSDLPGRFLHPFRDRRILLVVERADLPCDPQEELEKIDGDHGPAKGRNLVRWCLISGYSQKFEDRYKAPIDFISKGITALLRHLIACAIPCLIYLQCMLDNRQLPHVFSHIYHHTISVENLLVAWREFIKGKRKRKDVQEFQSALMDNILELHEDLKTGRYQHGNYEAFKINDPKPRDIHKALVRDRLVHHLLYRALYPFFNSLFVSDSYSCRFGKGTHKAIERFTQFGRKVSRNHTRTAWVLKCDIRKFFASIHHDTLKEILARRIPSVELRTVIERIIDSFETAPGRGLPLGNLTSQLLVNVYMNEFDQFVKHRLKAKFYVRYADDFVIMSTDRDELERLLSSIRDFLNLRLKLDLHPDKVYIKTIASGVDFLGWVHFPHHKVLRASTRRRMVRNLANPTKEQIASYKGLLSKGNAWKLSTRYLAN